MTRFYPLLLLVSFYGCLPAITTTYESARMLRPNAVEVQGNSSLYYGDQFKYPEENWGVRTRNIGGSLAYGLDENFSVRGRFEQIILNDRVSFFEEPKLEPGTAVNYVELNLKYGWANQGNRGFIGAILGPKTNIRTAVSLPIGHFSAPAHSVWYLGPCGHVTYSKSNNFEFSVVSKLHFWMAESRPLPWFSIGMAFGFSKNLDLWAIRPEIGYDLVNLSLGLGFSYLFNNSSNSSAE